MRTSILTFLLCTSVFGLAQTLVLDVPVHQYQVDEANALIVSHLEDIGSYSDLSSLDGVLLSLDGTEYRFQDLPRNLSYSSSYLVETTTQQYTLYFTALPLISITTPDTIVNEPKVHARFEYSDSTQVLQADIGIELRGGFSRSFPKKTFDIEFWEDPSGVETMNVQLGSLRSDDDWVLDALYNEPLRIRSHFASKLWSDMHTPYYQSIESEAQAGAQTEYVEVFVNGSYNGLYDLSEQVDRKQLKLKSFDGIQRGELHKGVDWQAATVYSGSPNFNNTSRYWSGYDMKYPKADEATDWSDLHAFTDFVVNSPDEHFRDSIWEKFNFDNHLDYFIFLNLLRATDNTGKNIYVAKYDVNEPYFNVPWDLDGCFGTIWNGMKDNTSNDILANGLMNRVIALNPADYHSTISSKWNDYRASLLDERTLRMSLEAQFTYFEDNRIYERESLVFPNYTFARQDLDYMLDWVSRRLAYLDGYFGSSSIGSDNLESKDMLYLYPNPAMDHIHLKNVNLNTERSYKIFNSFGVLVNIGRLDGSYIVINKLAPGMYILLTNGQAARFEAY